MAGPDYNFQYCQKLIVFSQDWESILLARRQGEADYDGMFSFIGGKLETTDADLIAGLRREKNEEIGLAARILVYLTATKNILFRKADGSCMIVPHYVAQYVSGDIALNQAEYSEYRWVELEDLPALEPKIATIPAMVAWAQLMRPLLKPEEAIEL